MMLKELFKFHSKDEDFRVKCLILILLGIALIINPANAYTQVWSANDIGTGTSENWEFMDHLVVNNMSAFEREISKYTWQGIAKDTDSGGSGGTYDCYINYAAQFHRNCTLTVTIGTYNTWSSTTAELLLDPIAVTPETYTGSGTYEILNRANNHDFGFYGHWIEVNKKNVDPDDSSKYAVKQFVASGYYVNGTQQSYTGTALEAPVINDFTNDMSCYYPNQAIAFSSDVEGELEDQLTWTWLWEIYDGETKISEDTDPVEAIMTAPGVGVYDVQLTVTNDAGTDFLQKLDMINVTLAGNCTGINNWSPFPTVPTVTPTSAVFPTMTVPPVPFINKTGISDMINESLWGNYSAAYRKYIDEVGDSVNQTVTGATGLVMTPFAFIVQGIAVVLDLFSTSLASLMTYTTIPLSITSRVINVMPWQMQSIITAGLAIDAIFLLVLGKG